MLRVALLVASVTALTLGDIDWLERARGDMREKGLSEEEIDRWLGEERVGDLDRALEDLKRGSEYSWEEARGYEDCEIFRKERMEKWGEMRNKNGGSYGKGGKSWSKGKWDKKKMSAHSCPYKPKPLDEICAVTECPVIEEVNGTGCGYTARILEESVWAGTPLEDNEDPAAFMEGFWRLFRYINGSNSDGTKIAMTVPVVNIFFMDTSSHRVISSYMYFYLPAAFQDSPPQPTGDGVFLDTFARQYVYSRALGGNSPSKERWQRYFTDLYRALKMDGITPDLRKVGTAMFTRPYYGRQRQEAMYFGCMDD